MTSTNANQGGPQGLGAARGLASKAEEVVQKQLNSTKVTVNSAQHNKPYLGRSHQHHKSEKKQQSFFDDFENAENEEGKEEEFGFHDRQNAAPEQATDRALWQRGGIQGRHPSASNDNTTERATIKISDKLDDPIESNLAHKNIQVPSASTLNPKNRKDINFS